MAQKLEQSPQSVDYTPDYAEDEPGESVSVAPVNIPLTAGQRQHLEVLIALEEDDHIRGVLLAFLHEGIPPEGYSQYYLSQFAHWGDAADADEYALDLLDRVRYSNWDAYLEEAEILPYLNEGTREYLEEHFPEEDLTTRDELQTFLQGRLNELVPEFNSDSIDWDILTAEGMVLVYIAALNAGVNAYHDYATLNAGVNAYYNESKLRAYKGDERTAISDEMDIIAGLLDKVVKTPLEDTDTLVDAFDLQREEYVVAYLRPKVELIYGALGVDLPLNWADYQDGVVLANMLHDGIEHLRNRQQSDETFLGEYDPATYQLDRDYERNYRTINDDYVTLAGIQTPDLYPFIRFAIGFFKPADVVLTGIEVYNSLVIQGDLGAAAGDVAGFFIPGIANSTLRQAVPGANEMLLNVATSAAVSVLGNMHPGEGQIDEEDFADALLKGLHSEALESDEVPDGWFPRHWNDFLELLNPEGGQFTQQGLIGALELGFRTQIRQELERQESAGQ